MAYHPANADMPHLVSPHFRDESLNRYFTRQQYCRGKRLIKNLDPARSGVAPPYTYYHYGGMNPNTHSVSGSAAALGYPGNTPYGKYFHLGKTRAGQRQLQPWGEWSPETQHEYALDFDTSARMWKGQEPYYGSTAQLRHWDENLGYLPSKKGRPARMWSPTLSHELRQESTAADRVARQLYGDEYRLQYPVGWGRGNYAGSSPQVLAELAKVESDFEDYTMDDDYESADYAMGGDHGMFVKLDPSIGTCACQGQCPFTQPAYSI